MFWQLIGVYYYAPIALVENYAEVVFGVYLAGSLLSGVIVYYTTSESQMFSTWTAIGLLWGLTALLFYWLAPLFLIAWLVLEVTPKLIDPAVKAVFSRTLDENPMGRLRRIPYSHGRRRVYLEVHDETGRHSIPVPPDTETVTAALAWIHHMDEGEYNPVVEV